jgi:pseudoazurin
MIKMLCTLSAAAALAAICGPAAAAEYPVKEVNMSGDTAMAFEPAFLKIKPGDTIRVITADKGHNVESIPGMAPDGTAPVASVMSHDIVLTFAKPGLYGFKCTPHFGLGMVLLVEVGAKPSNLVLAKAAADRLPPMPRKRFSAEWAQVR